MRNSRRIIVAFMMALSLSGAVLKADGGTAPKQGGICGFMLGVSMRLPADVAPTFLATMERVFDCDF
jgi:hypothetical protein